MCVAELCSAMQDKLATKELTHLSTKISIDLKSERKIGGKNDIRFPCFIWQQCSDSWPPNTEMLKIKKKKKKLRSWKDGINSGFLPQSKKPNEPKRVSSGDIATSFGFDSLTGFLSTALGGNLTSRSECGHC